MTATSARRLDRGAPPARQLWLWPLVIPAGRLLASVLYPARFEGLGNVPPRGPCILCANHLSWLDGVWLDLVMRRPVRWMAKRELMSTPFVGGALWHLGLFPIERHSADRRALGQALNLLADGEVLGVFPEGHRSDSGALIRAHAGIGFIAAKSDAPIVPVGVVGTRAARLGRFWRRDITIRFGPMFRASELGLEDGRAIADGIMRRIAALLPARQRGIYADTA